MDIKWGEFPLGYFALRRAVRTRLFSGNFLSVIDKCYSIFYDVNRIMFKAARIYFHDQ